MAVSNAAPTPRSDFVDGVQRQSRTGIDVLVVGAGFGGLMAALECWRQGHDVRVLERAPNNLPLGDVVNLGPSGLANLSQYPRLKQGYEANVMYSKFEAFTQGGHRVLEPTAAEWNEDGAAPHAAKGVKMGICILRPKLNELLIEQARRLGIAVLFNKNISGYDEDDKSASLCTEDGERFSADVIIAADGLGAKSDSIVRGSVSRARSSGFACARVAFPTSTITPDRKAYALLPKPGERPLMQFWVGPRINAVFFSGNGDTGFTLTHKDEFGAKESWSNTIEPSQVVEIMADTGVWSEAFVDLVQNIPRDSKVIDWGLMFRDPRPTVTSKMARVVQIGDAAHSFLPQSGNGATQALEDAISVAACLRIGGRDRLALAAKVHEKLRFQRVSLLQRTGFANRTTMHTHSKPAGSDKLESEKPKPLKLTMGRWVWTHNPELYAREQFDKALEAVTTGRPFENTNLPPGHVYEDWTMEQEMEREAKGVESTLKENGDWST